MKILLDTCTFLWLAGEPKRLTARALDLFRDPDNDVFLSAVSAWEIAVKNGLGRLPLPDAPPRYVPRVRKAHGILPMPLEESATLLLPTLPAAHRDPFDRMLVCQALAGGLTILSPDRAFDGYPVATAW